MNLKRIFFEGRVPDLNRRAGNHGRRYDARTEAHSDRDPLPKRQNSPQNTADAAGKQMGGKIPFVRGVINFVASLVYGTKVLMYSADVLEARDYPEEYQRTNSTFGSKTRSARTERGTF